MQWVNKRYSAESGSTYVMAANMSWKTQNAIDGMRVLPIDGFSNTPLRPKYSAAGSETFMTTVPKGGAY